jgi:hypothetical protein
MTRGELTRARDIEALAYLQQQQTSSGQIAARTSRRTPATTTPTGLVEALAPLGLPETPAQNSRAPRWHVWLTDAVRAAARWIVTL